MSDLSSEVLLSLGIYCSEIILFEACRELMHESSWPSSLLIFDLIEEETEADGNKSGFCG